MPDDPTEPEDPVAQAYEQGDFARVNELVAAALADASGDAGAKTRARSWRERLSVDVSVYAVLGFALLLFCAIVLRYGR